MLRPRAKRSGFLERAVGDQVVVYDQARQRLHVLSRTAALVWRLADGRHTVAELGLLVGRELGTPTDESLISLALEQLDEARLLEERLAHAPGEDSLSRRELLHRTAAALVAGVMLPTITSCGVDANPLSPGSASLDLGVTTTTTSAATTALVTTTTSAATTPLVTTTTTSVATTPLVTTTTTSAATTPLVTTTTTSAATTPLVTTTTTSAATTTTTTTPAPKKVAMCHDGRTIMVDARSVPAHLSHGDTLGPCPR